MDPPSEVGLIPRRAEAANVVRSWAKVTLPKLSDFATIAHGLQRELASSSPTRIPPPSAVGLMVPQFWPELLTQVADSFWKTFPPLWLVLIVQAPPTRPLQAFA